MYKGKRWTRAPLTLHLLLQCHRKLAGLQVAGVEHLAERSSYVVAAPLLEDVGTFFLSFPPWKFTDEAPARWLHKSHAILKGMPRLAALELQGDARDVASLSHVDLAPLLVIKNSKLDLSGLENLTLRDFDVTFSYGIKS